MKITKPGVLKVQLLTGCCPECGCEVTFDASEATFSASSYHGGGSNGYYFTIPCPTRGCNRDIVGFD